jgi:hypothetical protein
MLHALLKGNWELVSSKGPKHGSGEGSYLELKRIFVCARSKGVDCGGFLGVEDRGGGEQRQDLIQKLVDF